MGHNRTNNQHTSDADKPADEAYMTVGQRGEGLGYIHGQQEHDDEHDELRLVTPYGGAGLKRKRVEFVPASTTAVGALAVAPTSKPARSGNDISNFYLSLVSRNTDKTPTAAAPVLPFTPLTLNRDGGSSGEDDQPAETLNIAVDEGDEEVDDRCLICDLQVNDMKTHIQSIAHMSSEDHSVPPHHLDRNSEGFKHMVNLGWNPDQRHGLGLSGEGIRYPIRSVEKVDKLGIGARMKVKGKIVKEPVQVKRLGPKQIRKLELEERAKRQSLHEYLR